MRRVLLALVLVCGMMAFANDRQDVDPADLSFGDNINMPVADVSTKALAQLTAHMKKIADSLIKHGMNCELIRKGEVVKTTIESDLLFAPNETALKDEGKMYLRPFLMLLKYPTMYKVVIAAHSDNTGEAQYTDDLTAARANAIDDFMIEEANETGESVIPYGMGQDDPIEQNNSIENRKLNRRVEIYVVPEWQMIETAKSGRLK